MSFKIAILISGRGSNMIALHQAILEKRLDAEIALVLSDQSQAAGLDYCKKNSLPSLVLAPIKGENRQAYGQKLILALESCSPDLIVLAGFMRILSAELVRHFHNRIVNIHPSLLPAFPGLHVQKQALDAGVRYSGCTVHFVDEGCDTGPILDQAVVPVLPEDDEASLAARILIEEHRLYAECLQRIARGEVEVREGRVYFKDAAKKPFHP